MSAKKILVREVPNRYRGGLSCQDLDGNLETIIESLRRIRDELFQVGYTKIDFEFCHNYESCSDYFEIVGTREETDKEQETRLDKNKKAKEIKEKQEKELYLKLKEKYGN